MISFLNLAYYFCLFFDCKYSDNKKFHDFNLTKKNNLNGTILYISESKEYIIKENYENISIIINANYVTIYIIDSHLNSGLNPLIIVNENIKNLIIHLNEAILSSSFDSGIIQVKQNSSIIINSKFSIIQGGKLIIGEKKSNLKINGYIGLTDKIKHININANIDKDFFFLCENEKIKFDSIYMEISSNSIFTQHDLCIQNPFLFKKNINDAFSQIYDKEVNFKIKSKNLFEKEIHNKENNTFYLNYLYFKHLNIAKEKSDEKILKKANISFKAKVSVIIPIYNVEKYLTACLDSIINQTLKEIEIICVNDGSTDDSLLILLNYSKKDDRIMIIDQRNRGLSEARNTGVKNSNGEFIYFIDSDDLLEQNALLELYTYGTKYNLDVIYFKFFQFNKQLNLTLINENYNNSNYTLNPENIIEGKYLYIKLRKTKHYSPSVCISFLKKQFYIDVRLSFYPGILHEDELFFVDAILLAKRTTFINKFYYYYRKHENSIVHKKKDIKNLYGCLISYYGIINKMKSEKLEQNLINAMNISNNFLIKTIKTIMKSISKNENKILSLILTDNQKIVLSTIMKKKN